MTRAYRPFRITFVAEHGERVSWDNYPSRATARKALREDADLFGLVDARVEFCGNWSRFPTQDRDIELRDLDAARDLLGFYQQRLSFRGECGRLLLPKGRARDTALEMVAGLRRRIAYLSA